jgi:hypothetical protein
MPSGNRCHSPAIGETWFCYFHTRLRRKAQETENVWADAVKVPVLEDSSAIQTAVSQVINALASSKIDSRQAGVLLYGLQIASQNLKKNNLTGLFSVDSVTSTDDGEDIAPEEHVCTPDDNCNTCRYVETCEDWEETGEDDEEEDEKEEDDDDESTHLLASVLKATGFHP